jgi:hypothetical protein
MTHHVHLHDDAESRQIGDDRKVLLVPELDGLAWGDPETLATQIVDRNDQLAAKSDGTSERFGLLPFPSLEHSMKESSRILGDLHLDGVVIAPIAGGRFLDEGEFEPLLRKFSEEKVRLLMHPVDTSATPLVNDGYLDAVLALSRLFYHDRIRKLPDLRIMLAHSDGVADFLADNIGMLYYLQEKKMRIGSFLVDFLFRKRLKGEEYIRQMEPCA